MFSNKFFGQSSPDLICWSSTNQISSLHFNYISTLSSGLSRKFPSSELPVFSGSVAWIFMEPKRVDPIGALAFFCHKMWSDNNAWVDPWKLVTIVSKLGYNLFRGRNQPTYIRGIIHLHPVPAGHLSVGDGNLDFAGRKLGGWKNAFCVRIFFRQRKTP